MEFAVDRQELESWPLSSDRASSQPREIPLFKSSGLPRCGAGCRQSGMAHDQRIGVERQRLRFTFSALGDDSRVKRSLKTRFQPQIPQGCVTRGAGAPSMPISIDYRGGHRRHELFGGRGALLGTFLGAAIVGAFRTGLALGQLISLSDLGHGSPHYCFQCHWTDGSAKCESCV